MPEVGKRYRHKEDSFVIKVKSVELCRNDHFVFPEEKMSGWQWEEFLKLFEELPSATKENDTCSSERAFATVAGNPDGSCTMIDFTEVSEVETNLEFRGIGGGGNAMPQDQLDKMNRENEIERALEELQQRIWNSTSFIFPKDDLLERSKQLIEVRNAAQNLINVLKAEKNMSKPELKTDIKKECVEPASIWKDVSELPEVDHDCIICTNKGKMAFTMYQHTDKNFTYQVDEIDSTVSNRSFNPHKMLKYATLTDFINSFEQMQKDIEELKRK